MIRFCSESCRQGALCSANGELHRVARARPDPSLHSLENHPRPVIPAEAAKQWILEPCWAGSLLCPFHRVRPAVGRADFSAERAGDGKVWATSVGEAITPGCGTLKRGRKGSVCGRWRCWTSETRPAIAFGGGQAYLVSRPGVDNGNSGRHDARDLRIDEPS